MNTLVFEFMEFAGMLTESPYNYVKVVDGVITEWEYPEPQPTPEQIASIEALENCQMFIADWEHNHKHKRKDRTDLRKFTLLMFKENNRTIKALNDLLSAIKTAQGGNAAAALIDLQTKANLISIPERTIKQLKNALDEN